MSHNTLNAFNYPSILEWTWMQNNHHHHHDHHHHQYQCQDEALALPREQKLMLTLNNQIIMIVLLNLGTLRTNCKCSSTDGNGRNWTKPYNAEFVDQCIWYCGSTFGGTSCFRAYQGNCKNMEISMDFFLFKIYICVLSITI